MPNKDGTGPQGKGAGTGRLKGGCAADRGNNSPGKGQGRRSGGGNGQKMGTGGGGRGARSINTPGNS